MLENNLYNFKSQNLNFSAVLFFRCKWHGTKKSIPTTESILLTIDCRQYRVTELSWIIPFRSGLFQYFGIQTKTLKVIYIIHTGNLWRYSQKQKIILPGDDALVFIHHSTIKSF